MGCWDRHGKGLAGEEGTAGTFCHGDTPAGHQAQGSTGSQGRTQTLSHTK